jgi:hypothetical protein
MDKIEQAKATLRDAGYFVENLWHVSDVQNDFKCTDEEALEVLKEAVESGYNVMQINESIREIAFLNFEEKEEQ